MIEVSRKFVEDLFEDLDKSKERLLSTDVARQFVAEYEIEIINEQLKKISVPLD